MGQDFAGIVSATGDGVTKYREGERVCGMARAHGAFAECTVVPEEGLGQPIARIPDGVSDADAAALPTAGLAGCLWDARPSSLATAPSGIRQNFELALS
jgi:NADPH:quinone reductase-like Zn-dependent oxidoreductase